MCKIEIIFQFIYFTEMLATLFRTDKIICLSVWSLFSFSVIKFFSIFLYSVDHFFLWYAGLYSLLNFSYYFVFKIEFKHSLSYIQYVISNLLIVILVTSLSICYYKLIMLDNDYIDWSFYCLISISGLLLGSLLFLITLIRPR